MANKAQVDCESNLPFHCTKQFQFSISFKNNDHCITIQLRPTNWTGAVISRCCLQSHDSPLFGSSTLPLIAYRRSTHYWCDDIDVESLIVTKSEYGRIKELLRQSNEIVAQLADCTPTIHNSNLQQYIKTDTDAFFQCFIIVEVKQWINYCFMKASFDPFENDVNEMDRYLCERESEIFRSREEEYEAALERL
jgi:hypothetical protein